MSEPPRSLYRLERLVRIDRPLPDGLRLRTVIDGDDAALAELTERAYAGTVDEQLGGNSDAAVELTDWRAAGPLAEVSVAVLAGVTDGNVPSERLLGCVGFERVGPVEPTPILVEVCMPRSGGGELLQNQERQAHCDGRDDSELNVTCHREPARPDRGSDSEVPNGAAPRPSGARIDLGPSRRRCSCSTGYWPTWSWSPTSRS
jgi:hypothetical protein